MTTRNLLSSLPCLPVTLQTRDEVALQLGLQTLPFRFFESLGQMLVRAIDFSPVRGIEFRFPPYTHGDNELLTAQSLGATAIYRHWEPAVPLVPSRASRSLWQELLPFPIGLLVSPPPPAVSLEFYPPSFGDLWRELSLELHALENALSKTEIGCLWLTHQKLPARLLLTHYVRKQRMRVGWAPSLHTLGEAFEEGGLSADQLWNAFGTQVGFYHLSVPEFHSENHLVELARAIRYTLASPQCSLEFRLGHEPIFELQL